MLIIIVVCSLSINVSHYVKFYFLKIVLPKQCPHRTDVSQIELIEIV